MPGDDEPHNIQYLLMKLVLDMESDILAALSMQAQWETWFHMQLRIALKKRGLYKGAEITSEGEAHYPSASGTSGDLDILLTHNSETHALEVKVESAVTPGKMWGQTIYSERDGDFGKAITKVVSDDVFKCRTFGANSHLVMVIAHSAKGVKALEELGLEEPVMKGAKLAVMVVDCDKY